MGLSFGGLAVSIRRRRTLRRGCDERAIGAPVPYTGGPELTSGRFVANGGGPAGTPGASRESRATLGRPGETPPPRTHRGTVSPPYPEFKPIFPRPNEPPANAQGSPARSQVPSGVRARSAGSASTGTSSPRRRRPAGRPPGRRSRLRRGPSRPLSSFVAVDLFFGGGSHARRSESTTPNGR